MSAADSRRSASDSVTGAVAVSDAAATTAAVAAIPDAAIPEAPIPEAPIPEAAALAGARVVAEARAFVLPGGGASGTGREARAGAKTARSARSAAAMNGSKGCLDSIGRIISSAADAVRLRFALEDSLEYTSPPFFGPLRDSYEPA